MLEINPVLCIPRTREQNASSLMTCFRKISLLVEKGVNLLLKSKYQQYLEVWDVFLENALDLVAGR